MKTPTALINEILQNGQPQIDYAADYAEPGYRLQENGKGILFANWNSTHERQCKTCKVLAKDLHYSNWDTCTTEDRKHNFYYDGPEDQTMPRLAKIAEYAGYEIEWSDEWSTCEECYRAVRTSADSYGWTRSYAYIGDCTLLCADCIIKDPTDYLEQMNGNEHSAVTFDIDLSAHGYSHVERRFENGLHEHQADSPVKIAKVLRAAGIHDFVFTIDSVGQFDLNFSVWVKDEESDDEDQDDRKTRDFEQEDNRPPTVVERAEHAITNAGRGIEENPSPAERMKAMLRQA